MNKDNIWPAIMASHFMMGVGIWIGIAIAPLSGTFTLLFWAIWLFGLGFLLTKLKRGGGDR